MARVWLIPKPDSESKIQENKDWNHSPTNVKSPVGRLGEQDPRKQGLKLQMVGLVPSIMHSRRARSKKTRIETPCFPCWDILSSVISESKIQENKDWNVMPVSSPFHTTQLGEQDPRKQGLKRHVEMCPKPPERLGEQDPRKQGLKLVLGLNPRPAISSRRARSKKTRIETL